MPSVIIGSAVSRVCVDVVGPQEIPILRFLYIIISSHLCFTQLSLAKLTTSAEEGTLMEDKGKMEEEKELHEVRHMGWRAMPYVIGNETFEKLGTTGTSANMLVYLTTVFHMPSVTAATTLSVLHGTTNLAPVFGAFLCDTFFGRYLTLAFASVASLLGLFFITLTAAVPTLHPPQCSGHRQQYCAGPTAAQTTVLFLGFAFIIIGAGGIRPCNLAFGADQFDHRTESGKKGISSFFNWYYFTFTFAMMVSSTIIIYIQSDISWAWGLAIPTVLMLFSCILFFLGSRIYVKVKPEGSPFTCFAQVLVASYKKRHLKHPEDPKGSLFNPPHKSSLNSKLSYTDQLRFLDKAAIIAATDNIKHDEFVADPWRLCSMQQVEETKCLLRIVPIWSTGILFFMVQAQNSTYVVFQALQSDRHLGKSKFEIPAASFSVFTMIALTIWIPFYDRILVPKLKKLTKIEGGITLLQRMGVGIVISIVAIIVAAVIEGRRRSLTLDQPISSSTNGAVSSMSALWLVPQLSIFGFAEAFNIVAQFEFYYRQFPENMRSLAGSLFFLTLSGASYLSGFLITIIHKVTGGHGRSNWLDQDLNKGKLDYFYFLGAVIGVLNFAYFLICAKWYRYKAVEIAAEVALEDRKLNGSHV